MRRRQPTPLVTRRYIERLLRLEVAHGTTATLGELRTIARDDHLAAAAEVLREWHEDQELVAGRRARH